MSAPIAPVAAGIAAVTDRIAAIRAQFDAASFSAQFSAASASYAGAAASTGPVTAAAAPPAAAASTAQVLAGLTGTSGTSGTSGATGASGVTGAGDVNASLAAKVVDYSKGFLGVPYVWGGTSPTGMDCSGLMQLVFSKFGIDLPRVSSDQAHAGRPVAREDLAPGDLVFFDYSSSRAGIDHVGMYVGDGKYIQAPHTGDVVKISDVDWDHFVTARRVLPTGPAAGAAGGGAVRAVGAAGSVAGLDVAALPAAGRPWAEEITAAARKEGVDPALLGALVWSESGFNASARSGAGAIGLGQLMPATAAGLGVNPYRPAENLAGAAKYLSAQLDRFGSARLALAAYNAGPGAVEKYGGVPPYTETRDYVARVMGRYNLLGGN